MARKFIIDHLWVTTMHDFKWGFGHQSCSICSCENIIWGKERLLLLLLLARETMQLSRRQFVVIRVTRCPTLRGTAQHVYPLSHVPHIETMSHIFISSSFQKSNHCRTEAFLKSGFYPMAVKKQGRLSSRDCVCCQTAHVGQVQFNLSPSLLRYAQWKKLRVTAKSQTMQI